MLSGSDTYNGCQCQPCRCRCPRASPARNCEGCTCSASECASSCGVHRFCGCQSDSKFPPVIPSSPNPPSLPPQSYQQTYFPLRIDDIARDSESDPFDIVIIGSGIGGGVLAIDLHEKNKKLARDTSYFTVQSTPESPILKARPVLRQHDRAQQPVNQEDARKRILVLERGNLLFDSHCLNTTRPSKLGEYGQMNDYFFQTFKTQFDMDKSTSDNWAGGAVYCLGGRSAVWGLFAPRINIDTLHDYFPTTVANDLMDSYYLKAEKIMNVTYPETLPLHRAIIDRLNVRPSGSQLPTTQWEWARIASEFRNPKNFDFAEGAFSPIDRLLQSAMDDPEGKEKFKILLDTRVHRLEPKAKEGVRQSMTHIVVREGSECYNIKCNNAVVCAGSIESAALLLRSSEDKTPKAIGGSDFGHVTDHRIIGCAMPFVYRNMAYKDMLGGMKLQTDIHFDDKTVALANISIDASSFLPRRDIDDDQLPKLVITYIIPSEIEKSNSVTLDDKGEAYVHMTFKDIPNLDEKVKKLKEMSLYIAQSVAESLDVLFVKKELGGDYTPIPDVASEDIDSQWHMSGQGVVAHELGSIPMPNANDENGVVDKNLKMQYGWDNVYVCDLSVLPVSAAANPSLSLAALALRLSDQIIPQADTREQPIEVFNLTQASVWVVMTLSNADDAHFGPDGKVEIGSGKKVMWRRTSKEAIFVYACECTQKFEVQMVYPAINAVITTSPPTDSTCSCKH